MVVTAATVEASFSPQSTESTVWSRLPTAITCEGKTVTTAKAQTDTERALRT